MFDFTFGILDRIKNLITKKATISGADADLIVKAINDFKDSEKRKWMLDGNRYFAGDHDILKVKRTAIGESGEPEVVTNLPNNKVIDNQYEKMVTQKTNYLLGQPFSVDCDNDEYSKILTSQYFNNSFMRKLKIIGEDAFNCAIGWLYIGYDQQGGLTFTHLYPWEIIPGWKDADHTELDYFIRYYCTYEYQGISKKIVERVEIYDLSGISYYKLEGNRLILDKPHEDYFMIDGAGYNWEKIPLIPFKYNHSEISLLKRCKSLQDGINSILSNFENAMEEDIRNTILVLVNYDGANLGEFRRNLATYGAVKVRTVDGAGGDLKTLSVQVNADNYKAIVEIFKKALIENCKGYDAKDDRLSGNPNQMNIQSMYSDIDLDANGMETEFQAAFEQLLWFIDMHLATIGMGDFEAEKVNIIFNRDMMISESDIIDNIQKSVGILSDETLVAQHPWVQDPLIELERIKKQKESQQAEYEQAFGVEDGQEA